MVNSCMVISNLIISLVPYKQVTLGFEVTYVHLDIHSCLHSIHSFFYRKRKHVDRLLSTEKRHADRLLAYLSFDYYSPVNFQWCRLFSPPLLHIQQSLAATLPPVKLFSQQRYFEKGPKKLELSYFSHSYTIFPPSNSRKQCNWGEKEENSATRGKNSVTGGKNSVTVGKIA